MKVIFRRKYLGRSYLGNYLGGSIWAEVCVRGGNLGRIIWAEFMWRDICFRMAARRPDTARRKGRTVTISDSRPTAGRRKAQEPKRIHFGRPSDDRMPQGARAKKYLFRTAARRPDAARGKVRNVSVRTAVRRPDAARRKGANVPISDGSPPAERRKAQKSKSTYFGLLSAGRTKTEVRTICRNLAVPMLD